MCALQSCWENDKCIVLRPHPIVLCPFPTVNCSRFTVLGGASTRCACAQVRSLFCPGVGLSDRLPLFFCEPLIPPFPHQLSPIPTPALPYSHTSLPYSHTSSPLFPHQLSLIPTPSLPYSHTSSPLFPHQLWIPFHVIAIIVPKFLVIHHQPVVPPIPKPALPYSHTSSPLFPHQFWISFRVVIILPEFLVIHHNFDLENHSGLSNVVFNPNQSIVKLL